jgi:pimeloyl-ACP methyl ester carboxylesterase
MVTRKRVRTCFGWVGKILLGILVLFLGLIIFGLIREAITRNKYRAELPPLGEMVSLSTHDIHLNCIGTRSPTVVFEADLDQYGSLSWDSVQGEVGQLTRACSYDRAGILWSDPGPRPRDGETIAKELAAVLDAAGEKPPYVMVGHAFGGAYVRIFTGQNPEDVCGMVLIDSSHPDMLTRFAELGNQKEIPEENIRPLIWLLSHLGQPGRFKGPRYDLPQQIYYTQQAYIPKSSLAWFDESAASPTTLAQSGMYDNFGDLPLIVISHAYSTSVQIGDQKAEDFWLELQQELTLLSKNSDFRPLPDVGHYIQYERPDLVIEAIEEVITQCRE